MLNYFQLPIGLPQIFQEKRQGHYAAALPAPYLFI
jgi:hypothetical protein